MRGVFLVAACACLITLNPAEAQVDYRGQGGCTKGMFWPFVRKAGDCLTDQEQRNGQTGVYGNPNAVVGTPQASAPASSGGGGGSFFGLFGGGSDATPSAAGRGLLEDSITPAPVTTTANAGAPAAGVKPVTAAAPARGGALITRNEGVACTKGWFWPFVRKDGDCLTDQEERNGQTGVYGNPNAVVTTQVVSAPAAAAPAAGAPAAQVATVARPAAGAACTKGWFWPFVRKDGDCLTDQEKRNGQTGVYGNPNAAPAAQVVSLPAAPAATAGSAAAPAAAAPAQVATVAGPVAGAACTRGWFWPFVRKDGDCVTDAERRNGQTGVYGNPNAAPPAQVVSLTPAPPPAAPVSAAVGSAAPAAAPVAVVGRTEANCTRGWFWPFVRKDGDCLTDAEKRTGQTGVYGNPNAAPVAQPVASVQATAAPAAAPAAVPAASPAPAAAPTQAAPAGAGCTKGWFWPFVRKPGDCPTDAERRLGN